MNFIINTVSDAQAKRGLVFNKAQRASKPAPYTTTVSGAKAVVNAIEMFAGKI